MAVDPATVRSLIEQELEYLSEARILDHIRELIVGPEVVFRTWDYGKPGEKYPCWTVLIHAASKTELRTANMGSGRAALGDWWSLMRTISETRWAWTLVGSRICSTHISNPWRPRNFRSGVFLKKLLLGPASP